MYKYLKIGIIFIFLANTSLAMEPTEEQPLSRREQIFNTGYKIATNKTLWAVAGLWTLAWVEYYFWSNSSEDLPLIATELSQIACLTVALDSTIKTCSKLCKPYIKEFFSEKKKTKNKSSFGKIKYAEKQPDEESIQLKLKLWKNNFCFLLNTAYATIYVANIVTLNNLDTNPLANLSNPYSCMAVCLSTLASMYNIYQIIENKKNPKEFILFNFVNNAVLFNFIKTDYDLRPVVIYSTEYPDVYLTEFYPYIAVLRSALNHAPYALLLRELYKMLENGMAYYQECETLQNEIPIGNKTPKLPLPAKLIQSQKAEKVDLSKYDFPYAQQDSPEEKYQLPPQRVKRKKKAQLTPGTLNYGRVVHAAQKDEEEKKPELDAYRQELLEEIKSMKQPVADNALSRLLNKAQKLHKNVQQNTSGNMVTIRWQRQDGTERSVHYELNHQQNNESASKWKGFKLKRALRAATILVLDGMPESIINEYCEEQNFKWPEFVTRVLFEKES